jgi:hypothetical protein
VRGAVAGNWRKRAGRDGPARKGVVFKMASSRRSYSAPKAGLGGMTGRSPAGHRALAVAPAPVSWMTDRECQLG